MNSRKLYNLCFTNQELAAKMSAKMSDRMSAKMSITSKFIRGKNLIVCEVSRDGVYFEQHQGFEIVATIYVNRNGINPVRFM